MIDNLKGEARVAPAVGRNREPILAVLGPVLPASGSVLEIASGTGEHAAFLAPRFPALTWRPSDPDPRMRASIKAWIEACPSPNLCPPLALDAAAAPWPVEDEPTLEPPITAMICINMIHISPPASGLGLLAGAGRILPAGGLLYLYGPFKRGGVHTAPSNTAFDASLRARNPQWGVRDLDDILASAAARGLAPEAVIDMPANNLSVILRKIS